MITPSKGTVTLTSAAPHPHAPGGAKTSRPASWPKQEPVSLALSRTVWLLVTFFATIFQLPCPTITAGAGLLLLPHVCHRRQS